ncbi:hypothetical protein B1748_17900 [Paenibacillus sp. MY03]|uniref:DNA-directed RNA polymerase subunit alpha C-terminal domain-containing protein n=1 Tax=Paenibacillus sp. MY03 TaxID=302980 RepID=UPI000B3C1802|nr:hypothetical protein B1748_17900 [Paenibacillus sp. MY03]
MGKGVARPLRERHHIVEEYKEYDIRVLGHFKTEQEDNSLYVRIANALRKSGIITLGRMLDSNEYDLIKVRGPGEESRVTS